MKLHLESPVFDHLDVSSAQLMADVALGLYADQKVTLGQAAEIAGMTQAAFLMFLGRCGIPVHYDIDDYRHDLLTLRERGIS